MGVSGFLQVFRRSPTRQRVGRCRPRAPDSRPRAPWKGWRPWASSVSLALPWSMTRVRKRRGGPSQGGLCHQGRRWLQAPSGIGIDAGRRYLRRVIPHALEPDGVVVSVQELPPEVDPDDGEHGPLERVEVAQTVAVLGPGDLPPGRSNAEGHKEEAPRCRNTARLDSHRSRTPSMLPGSGLQWNSPMAWAVGRCPAAPATAAGRESETRGALSLGVSCQ